MSPYSCSTSNIRRTGPEDFKRRDPQKLAPREHTIPLNRPDGARVNQAKLKRIYAALTQAILHVSKFEISNARPPASSGWSLVSRRIDGLRDCRRGSAV